MGKPLPRVFTYDEIREWVLWARRKQMTSGPDVAEFLGISATRVNEIERGEKPKMLPATRRKITERIMDENPEWTPSKITFPPLQPPLSEAVDDGRETFNRAVDQGREESPSFSNLPEGEEASPDSLEPDDLTEPEGDYDRYMEKQRAKETARRQRVGDPVGDVTPPKISGQMIAIEVDEDDIFELTIQVRRRRKE
jgi:hypothetical protein